MSITQDAHNVLGEREKQGDGRDLGEATQRELAEDSVARLGGATWYGFPAWARIRMISNHRFTMNSTEKDAFGNQKRKRESDCVSSMQQRANEESVVMMSSASRREFLGNSLRFGVLGSFIYTHFVSLEYPREGPWTDGSLFDDGNGWLD